MGTTLLLAATAGFLFVVNARRALRFPPLLVPAFFASWLVIELAPQLLLLDLTGTLYLAYRGALEGWQGWLGAGIAGVSAFLLWGLVAESWESKAVIEDALTQTIGEAAAHRPVRWREFAFPFKLWSRKIERIRDIPYAKPGTRRYRLDVWRTSEAGDARPCFLYVPGGAWTVAISNKNQQGKPLLIEMASQGFVCFAMNYPLSPRSRFPAHIIAVKRAIAWIREHAHEYGGDPRFLMISGNSAGGHLSSLAALTPNDPEYQPGFEDADTRVQAAAPLYGVYDLTGAQLEELRPSVRRHKKGAIRHFEVLVARTRASRTPNLFSNASPWHRVGDHAPPFFVIHGAMDTLAIVEEARGFVARLKEASQQPVIYAELPRAQHAFDQFLSIRTLNAVRGIARFGRWAYERSTGSVSDARPDRPSDQDSRSPTSPS
jgi:acetyl esterase/lipase